MKCSVYILPQAIDKPAQKQKVPAGRGRSLLVFFVWLTKFSMQNRVKILNSRVLAGCFVIGCEKVVVLGT